jgi:hypothetical protein
LVTVKYGTLLVTVCDIYGQGCPLLKHRHLSRCAEDLIMIVEVQKTEDGDLFIEVPFEFIEKLGWQEGDTVTWTQTDTAWILEKSDEEVQQI